MLFSDISGISGISDMSACPFFYRWYNLDSLSDLSAFFPLKGILTKFPFYDNMLDESSDPV